MSRIDYTYIDIFGVPVYHDRTARYRSWTRLLQMLDKSGLDTTKNSYPTSKLQMLVVDGFLSAVSASYFFTGRASIQQIVYVDLFLEFYDYCLSNHVLSLSKIKELWQKRENAVPENTFLFPLEELASKDEDFTSERERYKDINILDLREI